MLAQLLVFAVLGEASVVANVRPQIGYVYPPGGKAGTVVEAKLGTYDWTSDMQIFVHDPRVKIELTGTLGDPILTPPPYWFGAKAGTAQPPLPREISAKITIAADAPPGAIRWQAANANGATDAGTFIIGDASAAGAAEFVEAEKTAEAPSLPPLPVVVNGRISKITEIDRYRFSTVAAGIVTARLVDDLGKQFNGVVAIREEDAEGEPGDLVADAADTIGTGTTVMFTAKAGAKYVAEVYDADHAGDRAFVYRLSLEPGPRVVATLPIVVARGKPASVEVVGYGVATGALKLESATQSIAAPSSKDDLAPLTLATAHGKAKAELHLADETDALESKTTDVASRRIAAPARISAVLDVADPATGMAADKYRLAAKKGDLFRIVAQASKFGSPVDPSLVVVDSTGKEIIRNDDIGLDSIDAAVDFTAPADGDYDVIVSDFSGTPSSRAHVYRLVVDNGAELADFEITVPDFFPVAIGGKADFVVKIARRGGWKEPIEVSLESLPAGMTIVEEPPPAAPVPPPVKGAKPKPVKPPKKGAKVGPSDQKISLTVAETAAATAAPVVIVATTTIGDMTVERRSKPILLVNTMKPRCCIKSAVQDGGRIVSRGTTYPADVIVERHEGYTGPVTLQMAATQQRQRRGIRGGFLTVPPGVSEIQYPVYMPEWLETSLTARINVIGVTEVADPQGNKRQVTGAMDGLIVMSPEGSLLKISHEPAERIAPLGGELEIAVKVSRVPKLPQDAKVELVPDEDYPGLFTAESTVLPKGATTAVFKVRIANDPKAVGRRSVKFRATVMQDGRWPAISETAVPVDVEAQPAVAVKTASAK
jgi:hypothetical protein